MQGIIQVEGLVHQFGERRALDGLTFEVGQGEVFALLGPNGAGKTTTVRLLNGLYEPTQGRMSVLGLNPATQGAEVRRQAGVLTEGSALYERLTAAQNLDFFGTLAGMPDGERKARIAELLHFFHLQDRQSDRVGTFSKGMKQRLALARALLTRPPLVYLDEPTSGLDPEAAQQVHELIADLRRQDGQTVVLCTHNLVEAERLCDRVGVMNRGRLLACGSLDELRRQYAPGLWVQVDLWAPLPAGAALSLGALPGLMQIESQPQSLRVQMQSEANIPHLAAALVGAGAQLLRLQPQQVSLEEMYFKLQESVQ